MKKLFAAALAALSLGFVAPQAAKADKLVAMMVSQVALVGSTPVVEGCRAGECPLEASLLPPVGVAWPSSRRPEQTVAPARYRPFTNDCFQRL